MEFSITVWLLSIPSAKPAPASPRIHFLPDRHEILRCPRPLPGNVLVGISVLVFSRLGFSQVFKINPVTCPWRSLFSKILFYQLISLCSYCSSPFLFPPTVFMRGLKPPCLKHSSFLSDITTLRRFQSGTLWIRFEYRHSKCYSVRCVLRWENEKRTFIRESNQLSKDATAVTWASSLPSKTFSVMCTVCQSPPGPDRLSHCGLVMMFVARYLCVSQLAKWTTP